MSKVLQILSVLVILSLATVWADNTTKNDAGSCSKASASCTKAEQIKCQSSDLTHKCTGDTKCTGDMKTCQPGLQIGYSDDKTMKNDSTSNQPVQSGCCPKGVPMLEKSKEQKVKCEGAAPSCH